MKGVAQLHKGISSIIIIYIHILQSLCNGSIAQERLCNCAMLKYLCTRALHKYMSLDYNNLGGFVQLCKAFWDLWLFPIGIIRPNLRLMIVPSAIALVWADMCLLCSELVAHPYVPLHQANYTHF